MLCGAQKPGPTVPFCVSFTCFWYHLSISSFREINSSVQSNEKLVPCNILGFDETQNTGHVDAGWISCGVPCTMRDVICWRCRIPSSEAVRTDFHLAN